MSGRPYRANAGAFERVEIGGLDLADDRALFELLLVHPDFVADDVVFLADGRIVPESDPTWRTVVGWHARGGPALLGVTTGSGRGELVIQTLDLAEAAEGWPLERWDETIADYWSTADEKLRARVAERWSLPGGAWRLAAWTKSAWGSEPAAGRAAVGILAADVPAPLRRAIGWLARGGREIAAFEARRVAADDTPTTYWTNLVAGGWYRPPAVASSTDAEGRRRATYVRHTGSVSAGLLAAVEAACTGAGSEVAWSGEEWVRFDGAGRTLRAFPGAGWVDLQFTGADEGTLTGLRYRFGVPRDLAPPADAPPEVHLRLARSDDFSPAVQLLVEAWLSGNALVGGTGEEPTEKKRELRRERVTRRESGRGSSRPGRSG